MTKYRVGVDEFEELTELEQSWMPKDYVSILTSLDIADAGKIDVDELRDMTLFALQDLNPPDAAAVLLKYKVGTKLSGGQIRNYSIESQHERLWEQSADLSLHQDMFAVASMLNSVNAMAFPIPDALRVTFSIQCDDASQLALFNDEMDRAILVRMISAGMNESAILNRLFGDQIATGKVADADSIIWQIAVEQPDPAKLQIQITSSAYWLRALRETESFEWDSGAD
ncbi:MAG: hypothetical protein DWI00_14365 [Planctomycetota bacterium]|nr:MAG: hypothetical protein DWI00_14365 [Planctomycetota bacterium]